jgi:ribonuclease Z
MQNENTNSNAKRYRYAQEPKVIDIYGPDGLRMWLRVAIRYSVSRIVPPYRVHELKDIPMAPEWSFSRRHQRYFYNLNEEQRNIWGVPSEDHHSNDSSSWAASHHRINLAPSPQYGEVEGGRDIYPRYDHPMSSDGAPIWEVEDEGDVKVYAAPMSHGIPCVGYAVLEEDRPGRLRDEVVRPIILRNHDALKEAGFHHPMKAMQVIKELAPGSCFTFPDGTAVSQEEAVESPRPGRKVVICGDTSSARSMAKLAEEADVLVHEATNTCELWFGVVHIVATNCHCRWSNTCLLLFPSMSAVLFGFDKETNMRAVTKDAVVHGHSTPRIAGLFAKQVNANRLIMNHFSARYRGDATLESIATMTRIEEQALKASGLSQDRVAAAWDVSH